MMYVDAVCKGIDDIPTVDNDTDIAFDKDESMIGRSLLAMIEGKVADENAYVARTYRDAPNVDGYLFINTSRELMTGDFVQARVTGAYEYDLIGELEDEFTK